jgi:hypothetical protein
MIALAAAPGHSFPGCSSRLGGTNSVTIIAPTTAPEEEEYSMRRFSSVDGFSDAPRRDPLASLVVSSGKTWLREVVPTGSVVSGAAAYFGLYVTLCCVSGCDPVRGRPRYKSVLCWLRYLAHLTSAQLRCRRQRHRPLEIGASLRQPLKSNEGHRYRHVLAPVSLLISPCTSRNLVQKWLVGGLQADER